MMKFYKLILFLYFGQYILTACNPSDTKKGYKSVNIYSPDNFNRDKTTKALISDFMHKDRISRSEQLFVNFSLQKDKYYSESRNKNLNKK